jgi:hypothetical protein
MNALQSMIPRKQADLPLWETIEHEGFRLPPFFKCFHDVYDLQSLHNVGGYILRNERVDQFEVFGCYRHIKLGEIILDTLYQPEQLENFVSIVLAIDEVEMDLHVYKQGLIPIAHAPGQELLMLGVGDDNSDCIYYYERWKPEPLRKLADNIFEFFRDLYLEPIEERLFNVPIIDLYRRWGEKFWRAKQLENI